MTKREMFETIATLNDDNEEIVEFCKHEIELIDKRKTGGKSLSATQKANIAVKETILEVIGRSEERV